jgi:hypothetical protein
MAFSRNCQAKFKPILQHSQRGNGEIGQHFAAQSPHSLNTFWPTKNNQGSILDYNQSGQSIYEPYSYS